MYESGNQVKGIMGQENLQWDINRKQGALEGVAYDGLQRIGRAEPLKDQKSISVGRNIPSAKLREKPIWFEKPMNVQSLRRVGLSANKIES